MDLECRGGQEDRERRERRDPPEDRDPTPSIVHARNDRRAVLLLRHRAVADRAPAVPAVRHRIARRSKCTSKKQLSAAGDRVMLIDQFENKLKAWKIVIW